MTGKVQDISWTVYLANKKASWYEFQQLDGEHGYGASHPLRNADVTGPDARQQLIIDDQSSNFHGAIGSSKSPHWVRAGFRWSSGC